MPQSADPPGQADTNVAIYERFAPDIFAYLYNYSRARIMSQQDAEDIVVETFLAALESETFASLPRDEQAAWLRRVAHNKIIDGYRRTQRQPLVALDLMAEALISEVDVPEATALRREEQHALRAAIQQLTPIQQQILQLRFAEGMRCPEIAALLGRREDAVRKTLSRTLNQLRNLYTNR